MKDNICTLPRMLYFYRNIHLMDGTHMIKWFEIPVSDFARAKHFYETIFNIEMNVTEMGGYQMAFFPASDDKVSGAICYGEGYIPSGAGSLLYLNADPDLNLVLDRAVQHGGRIIVPKTLISSDIGYYAFLVDTEGNRIALLSQR